MRRRVVFPEPEGPSNASNSPSGTDRSMFLSTSNVPNFLLTPLTSIPISVLRGLSLDDFLHDERDDAQNGQQGRNGKGARRVVAVIENLHMKRNRIRASLGVS